MFSEPSYLTKATKVDITNYNTTYSYYVTSHPYVHMHTIINIQRIWSDTTQVPHLPICETQSDHPGYPYSLMFEFLPGGGPRWHINQSTLHIAPASRLLPELSCLFLCGCHHFCNPFCIFRVISQLVLAIFIYHSPAQF